MIILILFTLILFQSYSLTIYLHIQTVKLWVYLAHVASIIESEILMQQRTHSTDLKYLSLFKQSTFYSYMKSDFMLPHNIFEM